MIIRIRAGSDKRTRIVSLTKKGIKLIPNAKPHSAAQKTFLDLIGDQRWTVMRSLLKDTTGVVCHGPEAVGPLWFMSGLFAMQTSCPVYPQDRTFRSQGGMSANCQERFHNLFDQVIGAGRTGQRAASSLL